MYGIITSPDNYFRNIWGNSVTNGRSDTKCVTWMRNQQCNFYVPIYTKIQQNLHTKLLHLPTRIICNAIDSYSLQSDNILSWLTDS